MNSNALPRKLPWLRLAASFFLLLVPALRADIVFTEIHYHPVEEPAYNSNGTPFLDLTEDVHEFVEIQNSGASAIDLSGWKLAGAIDFTFPNGTSIPAGGFRVIAKNPARIQAVYGIAGVLGPFTGKLGNSGDTIRLRDAEVTVDSVSYGSDFPWAISANALGAQDRFTGLSSASFQYKGRSLQRVSVTANSNDPANWIASPATGPSPGAAQAITRSVPKPVVIAKSVAQSLDAATIIRASQAAVVNVTFSSTVNLGAVQLEYFVDDVNSTTEPRTLLAMTSLGSGVFTATVPGQADRAIVRFRIRADRGEGSEIVSPRADDPAVAPIGASGAREAWHGWFVTPARTSARPIYDLLVGSAQLATMSNNVTQDPRRVTAASTTGLPREVPYVAATAPLWNGTVPAVFATNGQLYDVQIRYHGSRYHRGPTNLSYKVHFPEFEPYSNQSSWFITGHGAAFSEVHAMQRVIGLPSAKMRPVDWYFNSNSVLTRYEQGEFGNEMLDEFHELQQQLNPGTAREARGELYKTVGNISGSQNNTEGPYTKGDEAPMLANAGWTQLQRYEWTQNLQSNTWKGAVPVRDLFEGMWVARGDIPGAPNMNVTNVRAWFAANWDIDATLTSMAILQWIGIWDDTGHNQFFWRRANGKWVRLGWDFDDTVTAARATQSIYSNEVGVNTFNGPNWWKDTFFKAYRNEFKQRLWELNNSFLDPLNLTALGFTNAASFASTRQANVNTQLALGTFNKPVRPTNAAPAAGASVLGGATLNTSAYAHPTGRTHASTKWEIRASTGNYEDPALRLVTTTNLVSLPIPFDQLAYGRTYFWRATHTDVDGHNSIVSAETSFAWGTASTTAGTLVLNEILADNRAAVENGGTHPDFIELRNNGTTTFNLAGLTLTDDPLVPVKFTFPAGTTLAAGATLVVWCDSETTAPGLHTGFALSADGETVLLLNGTTIVDSVTFGPQAADLSIGRIANGTGGWQANNPSPGAANLARTLGSVANLRINEWMAAPAYGNDWFELYNTDANPVALGGLHLSDNPSAPTTTRIPPLSFIAGKGFTRFVADDSTEGANHANFKLAAGGDSLVLSSASGTGTLDVITFGAQTSDVSEGRFPDGAVAISSFAQTASPAAPNWKQAPVVINEALANSSSTPGDAIEIFNPSGGPVDLSGWWLSDERTVPAKYRIPNGTIVPSGGFVVFPESAFTAGAIPFSLSAAGDEIVLAATDGAGVLTGFRAQVSFGASAENVTFGRVNIAGGTEFWPMTSATLGAANSAPKTLPVIINELMYHPLDGNGGADNLLEEFIELHNPAGAAFDLSSWRIRGDSTFSFPAGTTIAGGGFALVVSFDPANATSLVAFRTKYGLSAATPIYGPVTPNLANSSQVVELSAPNVTSSGINYVLVDKAEYRDSAPWPVAADGTGQSAQRLSRSVIGNDPANWSAANPTPGAVNAGVSTELTVISESALPGGVAGVNYSQSLNAAGGTLPYAWIIDSGALPNGVTLNSAGELTGIPSAAGSFPFTVRVSDQSAQTATKSFMLVIAATPLTITTTSPLPAGTYAAAYSQSFSASGGTAPYSWSRSAGTLPGGLSLSAAGVLGGTVNTPGSFNFTVRVADAGGLVTDKTFSLTVPAPPLTISSISPLPNAAITTAYSQALLAVGGVGTYSWEVTGGALPAGLNLSTAGDLAGTPTAAGTFNFVATVTDSVATQATKAFTLVVTPAPLLITTTTPLPDGIVGTAYAQTLSATGGIAPYTWTLDGGILPGVTLSSSGALGGTPAAAGTFNFTARVTDSTQVTTTRALTLTTATSGPLHHFTWDYVPPTANANAPFATRVTARDAQERLVTAFVGTANLTASTGTTLPSPIVITEVTDESEDQIELQNVSNAAVNTSGWFIRINDNATNINVVNAITLNLPATMNAAALLRISEVSGAGRTFFGSAINWSSTGVSKGWIMLFDAQSNVRDFFAFGWTAAELATLNVTINARTFTAAGIWSGAGAAVGLRGNVNTTPDSWQRIGTSDTNSASNFTWTLNGQTFGVTNSGLTLPWASSTNVPLSPTTVTFSEGEFVDHLTISQVATGVTLRADDGASHTGVSTAFNVAAALTDADLDQIPDNWETAHGLTVGVNDAALDADGDGATNRAEFLAGTDPQNAASHFLAEPVQLPANGEFTIEWNAVAGRIYQLSASTDLEFWNPVEGSTVLITADGVRTVTLDSAGSQQLFIRVEVVP